MTPGLPASLDQPDSLRVFCLLICLILFLHQGAEFPQFQEQFSGLATLFTFTNSGG